MASAKDSIEEIFTRTHNNYRRKHKTPDLQWDHHLAQDSQKWAKHIASSGKLQHDRLDSVGENIYSQWSSNDVDINETCQKAVDKWYSEIKNYDFNNNSGQGVGHFTQLIWKGSKQFGVGVVKHQKNGGYEIIVVGRYTPAGNYANQQKENVLPPVN